MRISPVCTNMNIKFRGNDDDVIAYDDAISQERRQLIREDYEYQTMPYYSIYEKEPRLDEYQLKNMLNFYMNKPKRVDGDVMSELPLYNVHNISTSSRYRPNNYRGSTLYDSPDWVFDKLKEAGIKTVINFGDYGNSYKEKVERNGLNYFDFDMNYFLLESYVADAERVKRKDRVVGFIQQMQKEYNYMGCECGTYKTDIAVYLNTLFNPQVKGYCKIYSPNAVGSVPNIAADVYERLTPEDKEKMGWTPEFEDRVKNKLSKLLED